MQLTKALLFTLSLFLYTPFLFAQWTTTGNNIYNSNTGNVGIGTTLPAGFLDVGKPADSVLASVLGRVPEGNSSGIGTYLGVRTGGTQPGSIMSFSLEHRFYGYLNSAINFYRGGATTGGFLTFSTNNGTEQMRLDPSGNLGIGTTTPAARADVAGSFIAGGTNVNSNTTKLMVRNTAGKVWAISSGENQVNETNFGIYDWSDNTTSPYLSITTGGNVLIGKVAQVNSSYMLDVAGNVRANQVTVNTTGADFVFDSSYSLPSLGSIQDYIVRNHHLPGIAPAASMREQGVNVGENQTKLLQKIEELTLYAIDADKRSSRQDAVIDRQQKLLLELQAQLKAQQVEIDRLKAQQATH
ncbi:hypothetical protein [Dinghuibacter silviterrae]|uniref:Uncharacterized protein n=1 Tax=Dinghuibacter silviterrae TaxID=1539049 RepID=A0A4R8DS28_9BACT|nr:hypothetical protein [Dinghuibacter silviterrae]TDW99940.1 hypothetical protein EDB95_0957 [Dinghuibacter silviterrae]